MILTINLRSNITTITNFQLKANNEIKYGVNQCYGVTKDPKEDGYSLVFEYAKNGDLHNNLLKNFEHITWAGKISSLCDISEG